MAISVGSVEVDVIPNTRGIYARLRAALEPEAARAGEDAGNAAGRAFGPAMAQSIDNTVGRAVGEQIGRQIARHITSELGDAIRDGVTRGGRQARGAAGRQGEETAGAFARTMRMRLEQAFRSMPKLTIGANTSEADSDLQALRARMEMLSGKRIGIDIDAAQADAEIRDIEAELRRLGTLHPNPTVRADTAAAMTQLAEVRREIARISADPAHVRVETDGTFGQRLRAQVQAAQASLPDIEIQADTSAARIEIARIRASLAQLANKRVGIDIDAAAASAKVAELQARLARLSTSDADIDVRVDAGTAEAQLAQVAAMAAALDGKDVRINVNTSAARSAIFQLAIAIGGLAAIPAVPVLAAGIGSIAAAGVAAGAGVGALAAVAIPAFVGIKGALDAQKASQQAATTATSSGGQAASQAASKALQLAGAQQALASAHRNAARQIAQAEQGVGDTVRQAARANEQAAGQIKQARQALADAYRQAADRMRSANEQVAQAEQSLADAQRSARQAQQDLTQARRDAVAELQDLSNRLADAQLSERDAALSVQEAQANLRAVQAKGANASLLEQQRAQLAYDQAVQRLKEQRLDTQRLTAEKKAADKVGVDGTETVRSAEQRLADARRGVASQQKALAKAQQNVAETQVQNTRDIAEAQEKVSESQRNAARVQEDGARSVARAQQQLAAAHESAAESIASAERQVQQAQLSTEGGASRAATAQDKYRAALAKLSPAARETFNAFISLRSAFRQWAEALQPAVMPIFTRALNGLKNSLPGLTPFVLAAANAISDLQERASRGFKSPWWKEFKTDLQGSVQPALIGLGVSFANVFKGMAGIVQAFFPHMDGISKRMQSLTGRFANWGTSLKGSPEFERFLAYASEMAPKLSGFLGNLGSAFLEIGKALSPLSGPLLDLLGGMAKAIATIAEHAPWMVQGIWLIIVATRAWTIAMAAFNLVMSLNPLVRIGILIAGLIAVVIWAYHEFDWFRQVVDTAWRAISTVAQWAWDNVLGPVFGALGAVIGKIGDALSWLWTNVWSPIWGLIGTVLSSFWTYIGKPILGFIADALAAVGREAKKLWDKYFGPAFANIGRALAYWWTTNIKPHMGKIKDILRRVGDVAKWLADHIVRPGFQVMGRAIQSFWTNVARPALKGLYLFVKNVLAPAIRWLWRNVASPAFKAIGNVIVNTWRWVIKPTFNALNRAVDNIGKTFRAARIVIDRQWSQLQRITRKPVEFIVNTVYNKALRGVWNPVAGLVGLKKLPAAHFAEGGRTQGGVPGKDSIPIMAMADEYIIKRDSARKIGFANLDYMNATGQVPGFADGGLVGDIWSRLRSTASSIGGVARRAASGLTKGLDFLVNPGKAWGSATKFVRDLVARVASNSQWTRGVARIPLEMLDGLKKKLVAAAGSFGGASMGGTIPTGQRRIVISRALAAAGVPPPGTMGQWLAGMNTLISRESGWNPRARNNWDINARNGIPSQGLAQTIPPTWSAYVPRSLRSRGILDPVGNVAASIRYIVARYGNITRVQQANANRPPAGYDSGGWLMPGQLGYNGLSTPEAVLTPSQWNALSSAASRGMDGGMGDLNVQVFVGDREITDIARAEVRRSNGELVRTLAAGRRG